jgi:repressor LexA
MLRVRGESMIEAGILDGDFVVAEQGVFAGPNDIVVAGIPGGEATVKYYRSEGPVVTLTPANPTMEPMVLDAADVQVYGKVVAVLRRL